MLRRIIRYFRSYVVTLFSAIRLTGKYYRSNNSKVLILSHALNEGGAPLVLWQVVRLLKQNGFDVFVVSPLEGKLQEYGAKEDIPVFVLSRPQKLIEKIISSLSWDEVLVNTIVMYKWVNRFKHSRTIWWIHEGNSYIQPIKHKLPHHINDNVDVYCVSEWSRSCMQQNGISYDPKLLYYAIDDTVEMQEIKTKQENDLTVFLLMGAICRRKCQLDLFKAIKMMSSAERKRCHFIVVGSLIKGEEFYGNLFMQELEDLSAEVEYIPRIPHDKINDFYAGIDVLICSSNDDPLPVVVTEAFMNSKCTIVSKNCGQSILIKEKENGLLFTAETPSELKALLVYTSNNRDDVVRMGVEARKLYEQYFSMHEFKKSILNVFPKGE